jgi:hypothetical protein
MKPDWKIGLPTCTTGYIVGRSGREPRGTERRFMQFERYPQDKQKPNICHSAISQIRMPGRAFI